MKPFARSLISALFPAFPASRPLPLLLLLLVASIPVAAQEYRGSLYLTVVTEDGQPVDGAEVSVVGQGARRTVTTDRRGEVRLIKLEPGRYDVEIAREGFARKIHQGVVINTLAHTSMEIRLPRMAIEERVVVIARTPLLDRRKTGNKTVVDPEEIARIPTARDPWAVLSTIPGLQASKVNVGGNYSGKQFSVAGKGDSGGNTSWVMDGIDVTDMAATGSSSTYYDFNSFQEIGVVTGGAGLEHYTPGKQINFVTKQGSNRTRGAIGVLFAGSDLQADPPTPMNPDGTRVVGNEIEQVLETLFDVGGPIVADKAWYWLGFSQSDIENQIPGAAGTQLLEDARLRTFTAKINATVDDTRFKAFFNKNDKGLDGLGASPRRPPPTTWNQSGHGDGIYSLDVSHFFTPNLEVSAQYSHVGQGFQVIPQGTATQIRLDEDYNWQDTFYDGVTERPQDQYALRGNWFAESGPVSHELKFGFKYKEVTVQTTYGFGTQDVYAVEAWDEVWLMRQGTATVGAEYTSAWVGDTLLINNWTLDVGARYIKQQGHLLPSTSRANALCPTCLPEVHFPGSADAWPDTSYVLPRAGLTYAFGRARRQLARASVSRYVDQFSTDALMLNHPMSPAEIDYLWNDTNGNQLVDVGEFDPGLPDPVTGVTCLFDPATGAGPISVSNVDPCNPTRTNTPIDVVDPEIEAPRTDELILGYEVEVMTDFTIGLTYTWREMDRAVWSALRDLANGGILDSSYWVPDAAVSGTIQCYDSAGPCEIPQGDNFTVQPYVLSDEAVFGPDGIPGSGDELTDSTRPTVFANRAGYRESFNGIELVATKRLSNRWMLRGFIAWQDWKKHIDCFARGPTGECTSGPGIQNPTNTVGDSTLDDSPVTINSGSGLAFGNASWQYNVNGLYQLPGNFTISANLQGHQGYSLPLSYQVRVDDPDGRRNRPRIQVFGSNWYRKNDLHVFDLRLSKLLVRGETSIDISAEVFNLFNADTIVSLSGQNREWGRIYEVLSPRVIRLGARISF